MQEMIQRARRKRMMEKSGAKIKLGMMRHLFIIIDMSQCMELQVNDRTSLRPDYVILPDAQSKFHT